MIAVLIFPLLIVFSVDPPNPSPHLPSIARPADTEPPDPARPQPSGPELQAAAPALLWPSAVHPAEPAAILGLAKWRLPGTPAEPLYPPPEAQPVLDRQPRGSYPDRIQQVRLSHCWPWTIEKMHFSSTLFQQLCRYRMNLDFYPPASWRPVGSAWSVWNFPAVISWMKHVWRSSLRRVLACRSSTCPPATAFNRSPLHTSPNWHACADWCCTGPK